MYSLLPGDVDVEQVKGFALISCTAFYQVTLMLNKLKGSLLFAFHNDYCITLFRLSLLNRLKKRNVRENKNIRVALNNKNLND